MTKKPYETVVTFYSREDDSLVGEYPLKIEERRLRELLNVPPDEFLGGGYPISERERLDIEAAIGRHLELDRYFYFVQFFRAD